MANLVRNLENNGRLYGISTGFGLGFGWAAGLNELKSEGGKIEDPRPTCNVKVLGNHIVGAGLPLVSLLRHRPFSQQPKAEEVIRSQPIQSSKVLTFCDIKILGVTAR